MRIAGMLLGCLLLGQASQRQLTLPPDMVAEAIRLPAGGALTGRPLGLLAALQSTADRREQLEIARAYWRLAQAVAEYRFCLNHVQELEPIKARGDEEAFLRLVRAAAAAQLQEAEVGAVRAQHELAGLARLSANSPLPLPADRPHVGAYRTGFNELFAGRTPPEPARLAEKILPLQRQAIDAQAAAVQAAEDAMLAVMDNYRSGRADAAAVASCSRDLLRQRRAFIRSVCGYNRNIADYGLAVAGPAAGPQALVEMLIGPVRQAAAPATSGSRWPVRPTGANEPTLAPPRKRSKNEPTLAPPREGWRANEPAPPRDKPKLKPAGKNEPTLAPPRGEAQGEEKSADTPQKRKPEKRREDEKKRLAPVDPQSSSSPPPLLRTVNKSPLPTNLRSVPGEGQGKGMSAAAATPLYPALVDASPVVRAKQLTVSLHWDRSLPKEFGNPISLTDCLLRDGGGQRRATVGAYWLLRQRAAQYQLLAEQVELFDGLVPAALERRNEPTGAADILRVRWAQLAAQATMREAQAALVEAQYALALRIGAIADAAWPLASTVPHSGGYLLKLEAQPPSLVESWPVRRLAATIPGLGQNVRQRATAVVEADVARVAAAKKYRAGGVSIDRAIEGVTGQTEQTMAFLDSLAEYNRAIAEYAIAVLPPGTSADKLVTALVVKP